jgi:hypothetical protein
MKHKPENNDTLTERRMHTAHHLHEFLSFFNAQTDFSCQQNNNINCSEGRFEEVLLL